MSKPDLSIEADSGQALSDSASAPDDIHRRAMPVACGLNFRS
jgi:hypothetical protein